jgi:hypothetical protein
MQNPSFSGHFKTWSDFTDHTIKNNINLTPDFVGQFSPASYNQNLGKTQSDIMTIKFPLNLNWISRNSFLLSLTILIFRYQYVNKIYLHDLFLYLNFTF